MLSPYPDEFLYSWIRRLAKENLLSVASFARLHMDQPVRSERELPFDVRAGFLKLCEIMNIDAAKTYLALSTYPFEALFMTKGQQVRYINNVFRPKGKLNPPVNKLIKKIRICPECQKTDLKKYGETYIHRSHQLPGVCTCYEHKCLLQDDSKSCLDSKDSLERLNAHTAYVQRLFDAAVGSADHLVKRYVCDSCGEIYYTSPEAIKMGWGCPYCESSEESVFKGLVETIGKGEYSVESVFESLDKNVLFHHKLCDQKQEMKPRKFLFEEQRCSCMHRITEAEARQRIEEHKGFRLLEFHNTLMPVTIFHEECGKDFPCDYQKFLQFPGCRCCKPSRMTAELYAQRVHGLVGDEYTIIQGFVDQHTKVHIRHNPCGNIQPYKPSAFLDGQRCKECCKQISRWQDMLQLLSEYKDMYGNTNIAKREFFKERPLGQWCNRQRALYKKGCLKKNREQQLLEMGFLFQPLDSEWHRRYVQYKRYVVATGSFVISKRTDFEGEHLGAWVVTQRNNYKNGKLSKERTLLMRELDSGAFA